MDSKLLHDFLCSAPDAVMAIDASGRVLDLNPSASDLFRVERSAAIGRPIAEFLPDAPRPEAAAPEDRRATATATADPTQPFDQALALTGRRVDGTEFPAEAVLAQTGDNPAVHLAWIRDLTAREALRSESFRRSALLGFTEWLSGAGSWEWDPADRRLVCSENLRRLLGFGRHSHVSPQDLLHDHTHPDDRARLDQALEQAIGERDVSPLDARFRGADGELRYIRFAARRIADDERQVDRVIGVIRDVTDERLAGRRIEMRVAVSRTLAQWSTLDQSAPDLLKAIAIPLGCEVATLWLPDGAVLIPHVTWTAARLAGSRFERTTRALRLPRGIDLAGSAWELRRPVDLSTLTADRSYIRHEDARGAGLRTAVALPAKCGEEVVAVIDLHAADKVQITPQALQTLGGVGYEIGNVLSSRRGQLAPNPLTRRELEVLKLAAEGLATPEIARSLVVAPSTVKTHLDHIYGKLAVSDRAAAVAHALRRGLID